MQSSRFLPGRVLVQVQPGARCGRGRLARHFVANEEQAGSNPVVRPNECPRSTKAVQWFRKPPASVRFRPRARHALATTPSSNGSGSENTNLRMTVRVRPGVATRGRGKQLTWWWGRFHTPNAQGSIPWLATTTTTRCGLNLVRARGPGPRDWWFESTHLDDTASSSPGGDRSPTNCWRRVRFPGSLPDKRPTEVRLLHGDTDGVRGVVVARGIVTLAERVRFPSHTRSGEACSMGASCTCNAAAAGSIPVLSTPPTRSGIVQRQDAGL